MNGGKVPRAGRKARGRLFTLMVIFSQVSAGTFGISEGVLGCLRTGKKYKQVVSEDGTKSTLYRCESLTYSRSPFERKWDREQGCEVLSTWCCRNIMGWRAMEKEGRDSSVVTEAWD